MCAFVGQLSNTSHPLWRCQRAPAERGKLSEQSAEGVPLSDTCQSIHTPSGGANELQLSRASPVPVRCTCAFLGHLSHNSHPLWRCQRAPAEQGQPSEQSAEGVPLSDTCQSIHTPSG